MAKTMDQSASVEVGWRLADVGRVALRSSLVIILLWVGALKFTAYEAEGVAPLVANSPLMSWAYSVFSVRSFGVVLGVVEIVLGLLIATRPFAPLVSAVGSIGAIGMFLVTLSFLFTTPGVWQEGYGFPFPSSLPGQFLAKDIVLLAVAVWTAGEALLAARGAGGNDRAYDSPGRRSR